MVTFLIGARTCDPIKNRILTPTSAPPTVGEKGVLFYSLMNSGGLDLTHTEVPTSQRGRGLGTVLAKVCRSRLAGRIKCVTCETKSGASVKEYMSSVASLLWVWLARLVLVSFQTFALYLPGSPGVR